MKTTRKLVAFAVLAIALPACEVFEDQTPDFIAFRMSGPPGSVVSIVYSKEFVAGVNEIGVTQLQMFGADTVTHTLPIDTIIDVRIERQIYIEALTTPTDTIDVDVQVHVDDRSLYDNDGRLLPGVPWQFLYRYNRPVTQVIEVII